VRRAPRRVRPISSILLQNLSRFQHAVYADDVNESVAFQRFVAAKTQEAANADIERLSTTFDGREDAGLQGIGNAWSRLHYGSEFGLVNASRSQSVMSLVFIQTKDGNTGGPNPSAFGGGATDQHLIYEGLSRVAADAVLAGAGSVHRNAFFSVWHPELIALRVALGLRRHPAQIVISRRGSVDVDALLFNVPDVPVFLIAGEECIARHEPSLRARPWIRLIPVNGGCLRSAVERLRDEEGIRRVSAIGGRYTATQLVDSGLIQDIYLTTTSLEGGEPGTPWYGGTTRPQLMVITSKQWDGNGSRVLFEHCLITTQRESSSAFRQPAVSGSP
jgi:riboflavin biosynthesis pyrimidine reductase